MRYFTNSKVKLLFIVIAMMMSISFMDSAYAGAPPQAAVWTAVFWKKWLIFSGTSQYNGPITNVTAVNVRNVTWFSRGTPSLGSNQPVSSKNIKPVEGANGTFVANLDGKIYPGYASAVIVEATTPPKRPSPVDMKATNSKKKSSTPTPVIPLFKIIQVPPSGSSRPMTIY